MSRRIYSNAGLLLGAALLLSVSCGRRPEPERPPTVVQPAEPAPDTQVKPNDIFDSIRMGDTSAFTEWLFNTGFVDVTDASGTTPLITAAGWNRAAFVGDLLDKGADPEVRDARGWTALHHAASSNSTDAIRSLIDGGADPLSVDLDGLAAKDIAAIYGHSGAAGVIAGAMADRLAQFSVEEPTPEPPPEEIPEVALLSTDFRTWTSASGSRIEAAFIQSIFDDIILQRPDGTMVRIGINRLAPDDQVLARTLSGIDPHALAGARSRSGRTVSRSSAPMESLAARIGERKGWTALRDCRLLKNPANDGDSFHVKHEGKEYIFRLYFVDAPETDDQFPDRVRDQAGYFGISEKDALALGREASRFTTTLLASGPFNIYTEWTDARGSSRLKRYFALVETSSGDLDELLVREGLVRLYGMKIREGAGPKKENTLRKLETEAKREKAGGWKVERTAGGF